MRTLDGCQYNGTAIQAWVVQKPKNNGIALGRGNSKPTLNHME